jgi:hypothetical protein
MLMDVYSLDLDELLAVLQFMASASDPDADGDRDENDENDDGARDYMARLIDLGCLIPAAREHLVVELVDDVLRANALRCKSEHLLNGASWNPLCELRIKRSLVSDFDDLAIVRILSLAFICPSMVNDTLRLFPNGVP